MSMCWIYGPVIPSLPVYSIRALCGPKTTRDKAHKNNESTSLEIESFRGYSVKDILNRTNLRPKYETLLHFFTCTLHCHFLSLLGCAPLGGLFHPIKTLLENTKSDKEKARGKPRLSVSLRLCTSIDATHFRVIFKFL